MEKSSSSCPLLYKSKQVFCSLGLQIKNELRCSELLCKRHLCYSNSIQLWGQNLIPVHFIPVTCYLSKLCSAWTCCASDEMHTFSIYITSICEKSWLDLYLISCDRKILDAAIFELALTGLLAMQRSLMLKQVFCLWQLQRNIYCQHLSSVPAICPPHAIQSYQWHPK